MEQNEGPGNEPRCINAELILAKGTRKLKGEEPFQKNCAAITSVSILKQKEPAAPHIKSRMRKRITDQPVTPEL